MSSVLDTSAVIALIQGESGASQVTAYLRTALISSVNRAEILRVLVRKGASFEDAEQSLEILSMPVVPFNSQQATLAARIGCQALYLSLGDCACIALAQSENAKEIITADRAWDGLDIGIPIRLIR